jgi:hypothetical protein
MGNLFNSSGDYRIEISGWGLDNSFFAERTDLVWTPDGEKQVQLHRALSEGAIVFVRLLASEPSNGTVPVAYRVHEVVPMDCNGRCQMRLARMRPRSKESSVRNIASKRVEDLRSVCDTRETATELQLEEILQ